MLKYLHSGWTAVPSPPLLPISSNDHQYYSSVNTVVSSICFSFRALKLGIRQVEISTCCRARRRVRYNIDEDEVEDHEEQYGHNTEIAMLELYSQSARDEALLVRALVDDQEAEVLIFKGFSSCLSYGTSPDPSRSVLPERAIIKSIDRIRSPFDPSNIQYLEKGLTWETFKGRLDDN